MSQFYQGVTAGALPPSVPLNFPTDINSPAVPVANSLSVLGAFTGENFLNGIVTDGDNGSGSLYISLTNRFAGSIQTSGASSQDLLNFGLGVTPGTFTFEVRICAFEPTNPASAGYNLFATCRTDGATATLVGTPDKIVNEESAITAADTTVVVSGNNVIVRVTGVVGLDIYWTALATYTFGGV